MKVNEILTKVIPHLGFHHFNYSYAWEGEYSLNEFL